jgi:hypothetical protein
MSALALRSLLHPFLTDIIIIIIIINMPSLELASSGYTWYD